MRGFRFYHLALAGLLACPPALAADGPAAEAPPIEESVPPPPRTIEDIGHLLERYQPDPAAAQRAREAADTQPPQTEDRQALFDFYWARGRSANKVGRVSQQIADLRLASRYGSQGSGDYVRMLRELATAEVVGGNLLNAARITEEAVRQVPDYQKGQLIGAHQQAVQQYVQLGDLEAAKRNLREAEGLLTVLRNGKNWNNYGHTWTAAVERARGEVFRGEGQLAEAEGAYRRALRENELYIPIHDRMLENNAGNYNADKHAALHFREVLERSLSQVLLLEGKTAEAEVYARRALQHALERVGRGSTDTGQGLNLLAHIVAEEGRDAEAIRLAQESLRSFESAGAAPESVYVANARRALAGALVAEGRYRDADDIFRQMREGLKADPELLKKLGSGDLDWVLAMLRLGRQAEAEKMAKSMLDAALAKHADQPHRIAERRAFYAMALAARGARAEALQAYADALPILVDQARSDAESENGTLKRQRRLVTIVESYLRLLAEIGGKPGFPVDAAAESFRMADIARGSAVQRALTASAARANLIDPQLAALARREQDARRRIGALSERLTQFLAAPPEQQLPKIQEDLRQDIGRLREEREALRKEIAAKFPDYAELVDPKPATLEAVRNSLHPGEALVAFYFGEDRGYVWALRADGNSAFAAIPLSRAELAGEVAALRKALDPGVADLDRIPAFDVARAYRLYAQVMQPVEAVWRGASVLLAVSHAALGQLPLALLPTANVAQPGKTAVPFAGYKTVPWLMRQVAIAQLPSVTALAALRKLPPGDPSRRAFIGFGDPLFSRAQASAAGIQLAAVAHGTRGGVRLRNTSRTIAADSAGLALLPRLPDTNDEIREIAKVLHADPVEDVFLQTRATEKAVLETDLAHRRVVMFATHGLVPGDLDGLTQPALALTSPDVVEGAGSGLLTLDKVLTLKLNADWVVMSACNTAAGDGAGSEAVSGLGRAFFYAGARALLATNWPVETEAARMLMTDLFRRQAAEPQLPKAEALRRAMAGLVDGPGSVDPKTGKADYSQAHPLFWAPFVVVGD